MMAFVVFLCTILICAKSQSFCEGRDDGWCSDNFHASKYGISDCIFNLIKKELTQKCVRYMVDCIVYWHLFDAVV